MRSLFAYNRYRVALVKASQTDKGVAFDALAVANIASVVEFDTEGDSGAMNSISASPRPLLTGSKRSGQSPGWGACSGSNPTYQNHHTRWHAPR